MGHNASIVGGGPARAPAKTQAHIHEYIYSLDAFARCFISHPNAWSLPA